jgi:hypothetical protein
MVVIVGAVMLAAVSAMGAEPLDCPKADSGETELDCPWAGIARELQTASAAGGKLENVIKERSPSLHAQLKSEGRSRAFQSLWGWSINYDELAHGTIVEQPILLALYKLTGMHGPRRGDNYPDTTQHAGLEHTYGYLFSLLKTQFGYKRARWVSGELDAGFGLEKGTLGPHAKKGSFFRNVTYFLGRIAFRGEGEQIAVLEGLKDQVDPAVAAFKFGELKPVRIEESVTADGKTMILRTDLVPFTKASGGTNEQLLVYSHVDARDSVKLITAFPVAKAFGENLMKPELIGENRSITTRYNAFVPGFTGRTDLKGTRRVIR